MRTAKGNPGIISAILAMGGQDALADALGVTQPAISYYLYKRCPVETAIEIEAITGVSRAKIRPDLFNKAREKRGAHNKKIKR